MNLDGPIDPPEPPDVYADACRKCRQGRCEDCSTLGYLCACCGKSYDEEDDRG